MIDPLFYQGTALVVVGRKTVGDTLDPLLFNRIQSIV